MSRPGKVTFDLSVFSSCPLTGEIVMIEFSDSLLTPDEEGSIAPTANKTSIAGVAEALQPHHGIVRSFDVGIHAGTAKMVIWPVLSYPSNITGADGLTKIANITDIAKKNLFIPVPFLPSPKYAHVDSNKFCSSTTPLAFLRIDGGVSDVGRVADAGGGVVDMGGYKSKFPAWIIMKRHEEVFVSGRMFVRLGGKNRVPSLTLERLEKYEAFLKDPTCLETDAKVIPLDDEEYQSEDDNILSTFIYHCSRDLERDILLWIEAL